MKLSPNNTYLFFDLDGTLIVDGKLSDETVNALNYAKNKGCKLYINTGRSRGNFLLPVALSKTPTDKKFWWFAIPILLKNS